MFMYPCSVTIVLVLNICKKKIVVAVPSHMTMSFEFLRLVLKD